MGDTFLASTDSSWQTLLQSLKILSQLPEVTITLAQAAEETKAHSSSSPSSSGTGKMLSSVS